MPAACNDSAAHWFSGSDNVRSVIRMRDDELAAAVKSASRREQSATPYPAEATLHRLELRLGAAA